MKAISVRQPWAELIMRGEKTLDLRSYKINYSGPLAIHASSKVEIEDCKQFELDPDILSTGSVIGLVELKEIIELDQQHYEETKPEHLGHRNYRSGLFGWRLDSPQLLPEPVKYHGRQGVFHVPDELIIADQEIKLQNYGPKLSPKRIWDPEKPFELQVVQDTGNFRVPYRLAIFHPVLNSNGQMAQKQEPTNPELVKVIEIGGRTLQLVSDHVLDALRENGYKPTDLSPKRLEPFTLDEVNGVRLSLLFLAVKPITKLTRIEDISREIRLMTVEELFYWFSKCTTEAIADRAQKALRVMLSAE